MKKRIKIIKESLDEATLPPKGAISGGREPTITMTPDMEHGEYHVPEEIRQQLVAALEASETDPTQKLGLSDRLKNWLKSLVAPKVKSYSDEEVDAMTTPEQPEFKGIEMPPPPGPDPAELLPSGEEQPSLPFGDDEEIEPDEYLEKFKKGKQELGSGFDDILQEIKKRHFK